MVIKNKLILLSLSLIVLILAFTLSLDAQFAGGLGTESSPYLIGTANHLYNMMYYLDAHYEQIADINLDVIPYNQGEGWIPIGNDDSRFTGKYDGNNYAITGVFINRPDFDHQGLFGATENAVINNLTVTDVEIIGRTYVGALAGLIDNSAISNCRSSGNVKGLSYTGGLVGMSFGDSIITDCYSTAVVAMIDTETGAPEGMVLVQGTDEVTFNPGGEGYFTPAADYNVSLSSFYIGKYEVTQSEWTAVMGGIYDPFWTTHNGLGPDHPAYNISWFDAIEYCNRLSIREGLTPAYSYLTNGTNPDNWPTGWNTSDSNHTNVSCNWEASGYRLPTEMEREFAARGGVPAQNAGTFNDRWAGTDVEAELVNYAWYNVNSSSRTHPVGTKLPNELSLYDMSGNVWNWVWDMSDWPMTYPTGVHNNPTGVSSGSDRVSRGGSWGRYAANCTVSIRDSGYASNRYNVYGFRLSRIIP